MNDAEARAVIDSANAASNSRKDDYRTVAQLFHSKQPTTRGCVPYLRTSSAEQHRAVDSAVDLGRDAEGLRQPPSLAENSEV